jgi:two-component system, OmpR family, phosphate regulon sensor histidine kinase PhoR
VVQISTILTLHHEHKAILASMVEGVLAMDNSDRLITLNKAGVRLLGIEPLTFQKQTIQEVVRNKDLQNFFAQARETIQPIKGYIVLHTNGTHFIQAHGTSLIDSEGNTIGVVVVLNDVTQIRRLEQVRREFVAIVSHELRTPITSIKGFVETLLDGAINEPDNAKYFLQIIARQAKRLSQIIDDLLSLSNLEQEEGQEKINLTPGALNKFCNQPLKPLMPKQQPKTFLSI